MSGWCADPKSRREEPIDSVASVVGGFPGGGKMVFAKKGSKKCHISWSFCMFLVSLMFLIIIILYIFWFGGHSSGHFRLLGYEGTRRLPCFKHPWAHIWTGHWKERRRQIRLHFCGLNAALVDQASCVWQKSPYKLFHTFPLCGWLLCMVLWCLSPFFSRMALLEICWQRVLQTWLAGIGSKRLLRSCRLVTSNFQRPIAWNNEGREGSPFFGRSLSFGPWKRWQNCDDSPPWLMTRLPTAMPVFSQENPVGAFMQPFAFLFAAHVCLHLCLCQYSVYLSDISPRF